VGAVSPTDIIVPIFAMVIESAAKLPNAAPVAKSALEIVSEKTVGGLRIAIS